MSLSEFSLIDRFFAAHAGSRADVVTGIGDDAAVLALPPGEQLVAAVDTLVEGVHFPLSTPPNSLGHKALAVNLSDLAALGAQPRWATLALTLPQADNTWLEAFAQGFFALADAHGVALVGGDTTRGPLTITVQLLGTVPPGQALLRSGAKPGDQLFVSGTLGDAGLGLRQSRAAAQGPKPDADLIDRLNCPQPRVALGEQLRGLAHAAIDISDGLLADLGHVLEQSQVGATLWVDRLPRSAAFQREVEVSSADWFELPLSAGDDYELCFTVAPAQVESVLTRAEALSQPITQVGEIEAKLGVRCCHDDGRAYNATGRGYDHFA